MFKDFKKNYYFGLHLDFVKLVNFCNVCNKLV